MGAKNKKTVELSQEEFDVIKRLLRVAAAETDTVSEDFPDNKKAIKEANVIQSLYNVTFAAQIVQILKDAISDKSVLFFLDESKDIQSTNTCGDIIKCTLIGLLCVQGDQFLDLETNYLKRRIDYRMWHEMHFEKATGGYVKKYSEIVKEYMSNSFVTFHSRMFATPNKNDRKKNHDGLTKYDDIFSEESYRLIRSVVMKCAAYGYEYFYIVSDDYTSGNQRYRDIRKRLISDDRIPELNDRNNLCCTTGDSKACGALQVCDVVTSTIGQLAYKNGGLSEEKQLLGDTIIEINNGLISTNYNRYFPALYSKKIQHYTQYNYSGILGIRR